MVLLASFTSLAGVRLVPSVFVLPCLPGVFVGYAVIGDNKTLIHFMMRSIERAYDQVATRLTTQAPSKSW